MSYQGEVEISKSGASLGRSVFFLKVAGKLIWSITLLNDVGFKLKIVDLFRQKKLFM